MKFPYLALSILGLAASSYAQAKNPGDIPDGPKATLTFPNALPGQTVVIQKRWDHDQSTFIFQSNSDAVRTPSDLTRIEALEQRLRKAQIGAMTEDLYSQFLNLDEKKALDVTVTVKYPDGVSYLDKTKYPASVLREQSLKVLKISPVVDVEKFLSGKGLFPKGRIAKQTAVIQVRKADLLSLMHEKEIALIGIYNPKIPVQTGNPDFNSLARSAYNHNANPIPTSIGYGVNAGTFEKGLTQAFVDCLQIPAGVQNRLAIVSEATTHSMGTFRCLFNGTPAANWWHRASIYYNSSGDEDWIINNGVQSLSQSYSNSGTPSGNHEYLVVDDFAYRWPYPVFSNPTANGGYQNVAAWQCYNAINVGNVRHANQNHWELVDVENPAGGCTQTKNPPPVYGGPCLTGSGATCASDREMPHLVAPGFRPSGTILTDVCGIHFSDQLNGCGTSWSAPTANAMAANVIAADGRMVSWPEKVRAALLVTAQNVHEDYWKSNIDGKDGAGVIHGAEAVTLAQIHTEAFPNGAPAVHGIGYGTIYASDFNSPNNPIVYKISIPDPKPSGKHLRVVLTWDSNPVVNGGTNALSDLDLLVTSGSAGNASQSYNDNVEMVDIPSSLFPAGATVDARISKWINRIPAGSRANFFYYAIAWTWVKDHAD